MNKRLTILMLGLLLNATAYAGQLEDGLAAYVKGDYNTAYQLWLPLAEQDNAKAQFNLGVMYLEAKGVVLDNQQALHWFIKAAEHGDMSAQLNLRLMYRDGLFDLKKDKKQALFWYTKAANQGITKAQYDLAVMYYYGDGVPKDAQQAAVWFSKAAVQGDIEAQGMLGFMYNRGEGVPQDEIKAHMWLNLATVNGHAQTKIMRDLVAKALTPEQINQAQQLANKCKASNYQDCD